jgi:hypothetical protein
VHSHWSTSLVSRSDCNVNNIEITAHALHACMQTDTYALVTRLLILPRR